MGRRKVDGEKSHYPTSIPYIPSSQLQLETFTRIKIRNDQGCEAASLESLGI